jgi:hypothetical protein
MQADLLGLTASPGFPTIGAINRESFMTDEPRQAMPSAAQRRAEQRRQQAAAALRDNLRRRKEQQRQRQAPEIAPDAQDPASPVTGR